MTARTPRGGVLPIHGVDVAAYSIPTEAEHESDGTLTWDATGMVVAEVHAGDVTGLGYSYAHPATATLIRDTFADVLIGADAFDVRARWLDLYRRSRNLGRPGIASHAISAIDVALWDAKARALDVSLVDLLGAARDAVPIYGSGGFTSYTLDELASQLSGWVADGIPRVKMKVGRHPAEDRARVAAAREAVGEAPELMVDANGAYTVQEALRQSSVFAEYGVTWHEEPVSSDDLDGLARVREAIPRGISVAAGEYGYDAFHFRNLVQARAVDCVQADVTRCGGITGFLDAASLCWAHNIDLSAHCAPNLSVHPCTAAPRIRHIEYFHDHVRIESLLFDGTLEPQDGGVLRPDRTRPGHGLTFKRQDAERFAAD